MKLIGITPSKQGHKKKDFIVSISQKELKVLKILTRVPANTLERGDGVESLKNAHNSITQFLATLTKQIYENN